MGCACSVTKWMHLHGGDAAMHQLFTDISNMLVPGGIFVLEPQPWKSYKAAFKKLVCLHSCTLMQARHGELGKAGLACSAAASLLLTLPSRGGAPAGVRQIGSTIVW